MSEIREIYKELKRELKQNFISKQLIPKELCEEIYQESLLYEKEGEDLYQD